MQSQQVTGTRDWRQYSIELDVPKETTNINFGVIMPGKGTAWFDGLEVLIDGAPFKMERFDFDFEGDSIRGLTAFPSESYRTEIDSEAGKVGKKSLRLKAIEAPAGKSPEEMKKRVAACDAVHKGLAEAREELVKSHSPKEVDWAIVNARLVLDAIKQRAGDWIVRDAAMAENVAWILDQNPGTKIVLWAHNGHVSKQPFAMGKYLDQKFGKDHVAIAFATTKGEYQAIGKEGLSNHKLAAPPDNSYEAAFQRTGLPRFFLDLRKIDAGGEPAEWLRRSRSFRMIGALAMEEQFTPVSLPALFDAVIYLEETTAAKPLGKR
jgi:erythromycin esterase-like protein